MEHQPPSPPPLPVASVPLPTAPPPAPLPVQPLPYLGPVYHGRPGILTGISVTSIVVACISVMVSLVSGCWSVGMYSVSRATAAMKPSTATVSTTSTPGGGFGTTSVTSVSVSPGAPAGASPAAPQPVLVVGPNGFAPADRQVLSQVLQTLQPLNTKRLNELDNFLAENGQSVFPTAGQAVTARSVKVNVTRSGISEGAGDDDPGYTYFVTNWGTLNVYDDKVTFARSDPSLPGITTSIGNSAPVSAAPGFAPLTAAQVQTAIQQAQANSSNALDAGQIAALKKLLQNPQQQLVQSWVVGSPISMATKQPDGTAVVYFSGGATATLGPNGSTVTTTATPVFAPPTFNVSGWICAVVVAESVLSIGLAILLFVAAILMLRQTPSGGKLHRIYAWSKIPLALIGGAATAWMWVQIGQGFASSMPSPGGAKAIVSVYVGYAVVMTILALIYPVTLLIVLRTRAVREYYNAVR